MIRRDYFRIPIESKEQAEEYLEMLYTDDLLYHPEDDAGDIITASECPSSGGPVIWVPLFNKEEAQLLNERMDEVWTYLSDPCEFVLEQIYQGSTDDNTEIPY